MVIKAVCVLWVCCGSGSATRCRLISVGMVTVAVDTVTVAVMTAVV